MFTTAVFWLSNLFFILLDITGRPAFLLKYKIQADKNTPVCLYLLTLSIAFTGKIVCTQIVIVLDYSIMNSQVSGRHRGEAVYF